MKAKKKNKFKKARRKTILAVLGLIFAIGACLILLTHHLFKIQTPERLRYIKDYQDFTISIASVPDCNNEVYDLFQIDNEVYRGVCIWNVYANYGTVKAPLKMVLENNYIKLKDIEKNMGKLKEDLDHDTTYYEYRRSEEKDGNYNVTITNKNYQNITLKEITFEIYKEPEILDQSEKVEEN